MSQVRLFLWQLYYLKLAGYVASLSMRSHYFLNLLRTWKIPEAFKSRVVAKIDGTKIATTASIYEVDGIKFELDLQDDVQRGIYFNAFETRELDLLNEILPNDAFCLDVGANIGFYALNIANNKKNSIVHTFEPDPEIFEKLKRNCKINSLDNQVIPHKMALSYENSTTTFFRSEKGHAGCGSLDYKPKNCRETIDIETMTLDTFLENNSIQKVDLLKVDIEGHELQMIQGAKQALSDKAIRFILIEFNGEKLKASGYSLYDFLNHFELYGYKPILFNLRLLEKLKSGTANPEKICTNFLFSY